MYVYVRRDNVNVWGGFTPQRLRLPYLLVFNNVYVIKRVGRG